MGTIDVLGAALVIEILLFTSMTWLLYRVWQELQTVRRLLEMRTLDDAVEM